MAVRGPRARALATEVDDMATIAIPPGDSRAETDQLARELALPLALHVSVVGDTVAPFMAGPDTRPAELRATDSLAYLPADPGAAIEELERRCETASFTYVVIGSNAAATLAPVVARLGWG